jgi:hypothetical protein
MALLSAMSIPAYGMSNVGSNGTKGPGGEIKIPGTGLTLYQGGKETTPTGMRNAAIESGVTPEVVLDSIQRFKLPTTSNKEFQEEIVKRLATTQLGQEKLAEVEKIYGKTKAGTIVDNFLGARTKSLLDGLNEISQLREIEENRPQFLPEYRDGSKVPNKMLSFGTNKKAADSYFNYMMSLKNQSPELKAYSDSARKNIAPAGAKYLTTMSEMDSILKYEAEQAELFKKRFGKYPPKLSGRKVTVMLPEEQQSNILKKYLGNR